MKAYEVRQFGFGDLLLVEREKPKPGPNEVLVKFHAASLNYRDLMVIAGKYNPRMKLPAVPFSDGAGEVAAVGSEVLKWNVGDRVCPIFVQHWYEGEIDQQKARTALGAGAQWDGVLREFGVFSEESLVRIPGHLSCEEASTLPCTGVTAWHALAMSGDLRAGQSVLTLGTGGVSVFAVQFAKLFGARVFATTGSEAKAAKLRELGADEVINYREREDWDAAVNDITGKIGVDHVVEVGGAGTLARSINAVKVGGHIALIGALETDGEFNHIPIFMKLIRMHGIFVGSRAMFEDMNRAIEVAELRPVIDKVFQFDEVVDALYYMQSGAHFGKIVIKF